MTGFILAAAMIVLAVASFVRLPPVHPVQLWALPWAIASTLYAMRLLPYRDIGWDTMSIAIFGTAFFVIGIAVAARLFRRPTPRPSKWSRQAAVDLAAAGAVGLLAVTLALFLAQVVSRYGVGDALRPTVPLRNAIVSGDFSVTIKYVYFAFAAIALTAVAATHAQTRRRRIVWSTAAVSACGSLYFSTGRATLVSGVIVAAVATLMARDRGLPRRRYLAGIAALLGLALVVFVGGGKLIGKTFENNSDLQQVPSFFTSHPGFSILATPYEYGSAPIAALDVQVREASNWGEAYGCASLNEGCLILEHLGVGVEPVPDLRPFTRVPLTWNTYTAFDMPLIDWGRILAAPSLLIVGLATGVLWGLARRRSASGIVCYSLLAPALFSSSGSFAFTAPHLLGAMLISALLLFLADRVTVTLKSPRRRPNAASAKVSDDEDASERPQPIMRLRKD